MCTVPVPDTSTGLPTGCDGLRLAHANAQPLRDSIMSSSKRNAVGLLFLIACRARAMASSRISSRGGGEPGLLLLAISWFHCRSLAA